MRCRPLRHPGLVLSPGPLAKADGVPTAWPMRRGGTHSSPPTDWCLCVGHRGLRCARRAAPGLPVVPASRAAVAPGVDLPVTGNVREAGAG